VDSSPGNSAASRLKAMAHPMGMTNEEWMDYLTRIDVLLENSLDESGQIAYPEPLKEAFALFAERAFSFWD
jgi:hypothetical protein